MCEGQQSCENAYYSQLWSQIQLSVKPSLINHKAGWVSIVAVAEDDIFSQSLFKLHASLYHGEKVRVMFHHA